MARRLIIHAGQHKTGSTSIQHYLEAHHEALAELGVCALPPWTSDLSGPEPAGRSRNAGAIAHAVLRPRLLTPGRLRGKHPALAPQAAEAGLRRVNAALHAIEQETVLLSAEAFSFARSADEFERLMLLCDGLDWCAVMFLREPEAWLESWRRQVRHGGLESLPGATAGEGILDFSAGSWLTDHDAIRRFWGDRSRFLSYEEALAEDGTVFPAFFRAVGLDAARCPPWERFRLNASAGKRRV